MFKKLIVSCLIFVFVVGMVGCTKKDTTEPTNGGNNQNQITLKVWIMPNSADPEKDFLDVVKPFTDTHPNIKIEPTVIDWGAALSKINNAAKGTGEQPDITQLGTTWAAAMSSTEGFVDLKGKFDESNFLEATLDTTGIVGKGDRTTIPWFVDTRAVFYRKDACEKAGVDPTKDFATWDSFKEALKKLNGVEINGKKMAALGMPGKNDWNVVHNFSWWIWGAGGDYIAKDLSKALINTNESYQGIKYYTDLANEGLVSKEALNKNTVEVTQMFQNGEFATHITDPSLISTLDNLKITDASNPINNQVGVAPIPQGPKNRQVFYGGSGLAVFKASKNVDASIELLNFLTSKEAQVEYSKKVGLLPAIKSAYDDPFINNDPMRSVFKDQMQYGNAYPSIPVWGAAEAAFQKGFSEVWDIVMGVKGQYDESGIKVQLEAIAEEVNGILSEN